MRDNKIFPNEIKPYFKIWDLDVKRSVVRLANPYLTNKLLISNITFQGLSKFGNVVLQSIIVYQDKTTLNSAYFGKIKFPETSNSRSSFQ